MRNLWRYAAVAAAAAMMAVAGSTAVASLASSGATWPTSCAHMRCVNNHLNNLDQRLRERSRQLASVKARVSALEAQNANQASRLSGVEQVLACYGGINFAQYPHATPTSNGDTSPGSGGTWLDLEHNDNPANNFVYRIVVNWCSSG